LINTWDASGYANNARFVADLGMPVVSLLSPKPDERILDLGCGDGALTEKLISAGCEVVGVDSSDNLIKAALELGLDARLMDGHALDFDAEFDAVFSNAALHWMLQADKVLQGVYRSLKPGGRFVAEFGGHGNVAAVATALLAALDEIGVDGRPLWPWFFPTPALWQSMLEDTGFAVTSIELIPRPTPLPTGIQGWLDTFANPFVSALSDSRRRQVLNRVEYLLAPSLCDNDGNWTADYVRLRFAANK